MSRRADFLHCDRMNFEDPQFVERIRRCDFEALRDVVESYLPHILNTARASGLDPERAEDVTQATFTTFLERASEFEGRSHVRTWLFGILYRKISEARRGLNRERRSDAIDQVMEDRFDSRGMWKSPPQAMALYGGEIATFLKDCMERLASLQRMAFVLREIAEMDTEEICNILDVSRTNLGVLLYRGRNGLRECLEAKGVKRK